MGFAIFITRKKGIFLDLIVSDNIFHNYNNTFLLSGERAREALLDVLPAGDARAGGQGEGGGREGVVFVILF